MLGMGNFGIVLRATKMGQEYAVKIICKKEIQKNKIYMDLLRNEMCVLQNLDHPKVVKTYDLIEDDDNYYIVTEIIKGGPVSKRIKQLGPLKEKSALIIVSQIVDAVAYLHERGICHRDLKLENIMFTSDKSNQIKLIDFGFAVEFRDNDMYVILGSPLYMSPELVE